MAEEKRGSTGEEPVYSHAPLAIKQLPAQRNVRRHYVAAGRELCGTRRGKLRAGTEVFARDFHGGDKQLAKLVDSAAVVVVEK